MASPKSGTEALDGRRQETLPLLGTEQEPLQNKMLGLRPVLLLLSAVAILGIFLVGYDTGLAHGEEDILGMVADGDNSLVIEVSNVYEGYGNITKYPFLAEGYGINVEPYKRTELRVGNPKDWATYDWTQGSSVKDSLKVSAISPTVIEHVDKDAIFLTLSKTGVYSLTLTERIRGVETRSISVNMYCKYVRRELRNLHEDDLEAFMSAAETLWKVSTKKGREVLNYGPKYRDINSLAIIHNDLAGNVICDHLHGTNGYMFVTGHVALNNMLEQSLQAVNPAVSLPYWQYTRDADTCKVGESDCFWDIWTSVMFSEKFFGSKGARGEIVDGRWANAQVPILNDAFFEDSMIEGHYREHSYAGCFGQSDEPSENSGCSPVFVNNFLNKKGRLGNFTKWADKHVTNAFGLLRSPWNLNGNRHLSRFGNMCGIRNDKQWPTCDSIIVQQSIYNSFADWVLQVQLSPHGSVHTFIGGATGNCQHREAMKTILSYPCYHRLLDKSPDLLKDMYFESYVEMPSRDKCEGEDQSACQSSCPDLAKFDSESVKESDFDTMESFQYVLEYFSEDMRLELRSLSAQNKFIVMSLLCSDSVLLGDMLTSNSPLDVSFFHVHAEVERIFQRKSLSGTFTDTSWPGCGSSTCPGWCPGYKLKWFDYVFDSIHPENALEEVYVEEQYKYSRDLRNDELLAHLIPTTEHYARLVPYLYDDFVWRGCEIPKKYKSYVDLSLMNETQWVKPKDLKWLVSN